MRLTRGALVFVSLINLINERSSEIPEAYFLVCMGGK